MLSASAAGPGLLAKVRDFYERHPEPPSRGRFVRRYFQQRMAAVLRARVPPGQHVLDLGCGSGDLLAAVAPSRGVGLDVSSAVVARARAAHPGLHFFEGDAAEAASLARLGGPFDAILMVNVVTELSDVQGTLEALQAVCHDRTRLYIYSYSRVWQPLVRLAEAVGLKWRQPPQSWLPPEEVRNMLSLADWEGVRKDFQVLCPVWVPLLSGLANRYLGHLPAVEWFSLMFGIIARPAPARFSGFRSSQPSTTVVVPCRNEAGHVRELVRRLPDLGPNHEVLFVEGNSQDDTEAVIQAVIAENPGRPWRLLKQTGRGKADAVRLGFARARGQVLIILDADMGVAPEDVPRFVEALVRGKGELVNGSRMVYAMEGRAMRFLNLVANKAFALLFSWLLGQQLRDTLCGTKALYREDYERIEANRSYFGDFDPFGDFDLLFGAARLNLRIVDVAIRYHERAYGTTNISRFSHGLLLLRMSLFAARKLKFL